MPKPIAEQVVVVTGASSGIGLLTAREAARGGAKVVLAARNGRDLEHAVQEIRREGGDALAVPTDVTDPAQVERLARRTADAYGRIDTWISNAGVSLYATCMDGSLEDMRQVVEVDFWGCVHGARAALPHLARTAGAFVCVGSALSDRALPFQGAYSAAKHALKGWLDALRIELRQAGSPVRVTLIKPSSMNTPLFNKAKTELGVTPRPLPPVYEPELAAAAILRAAEGRSREVFVGGAGRALSLAATVAPRILDVQQRRRAFSGQKTDWPEAPESPHNLYGPVEDDGGVRGDFVRHAKRHSVYQTVLARPVASRLLAAAAAGLVAALLARRRRGRAPEAALSSASASGPPSRCPPSCSPRWRTAPPARGRGPGNGRASS